MYPTPPPFLPGGDDLHPDLLSVPRRVGRLDPTFEGSHHSYPRPGEQHMATSWQHLGNILATSWQQSCEDLFPQGSANALSSVTLGFGLYHLASFTSTSNLLILLTIAMGTAVIGGLATGGLSLLIQVLVKLQDFVTPFSERLSLSSLLTF